jgi:predicted ArsR family transcriptional regulator
MAVASTSKIVYITEIKGQKEDTENMKVLHAIAVLEPCTGRQVSHLKDLENSAVARSLNNLKKEGLIEVYFKAKCRLTGRPAQHYRLKKNQDFKPGEQTELPL